MTMERHSPLSRTRDLSAQAMRERYDKANKMAIVVTDRNVFESLADVLVLLKRVEELEMTSAHRALAEDALRKENDYLRARVDDLGSQLFGSEEEMKGSSNETI